MSDQENKTSLVRRVFSEDRVARTKKALGYTLNGIVRSALPAACIVLSLAVGKMFFENASFASYIQDNTTASATEVYGELGLVNRTLVNYKCDIAGDQLQEAFTDADTMTCFQEEIAKRMDIGGEIGLAPAAIVGVFGLKALPKGAAYFQIAYREAMNSNNRVLKDRDIAALRAQQHSAPPPPTAI